MHKILLTIVFLLVLFFPKSEVFGIGPCAADTTPNCPIQAKPDPDGSGNCKYDSGAIISPYSCTAATGTVTRPGDAPAAAPGAAGTTPVAPAAPQCSSPTDANCTKARGFTCSSTPGNDEVKTAIGCIPTQPQKLVEGILRFGTLAAGGIAFLLMILGALQMITAEGNPESIKHAQERFYSAIIGLLLIIFAVLLMQVIGYNILGLSGFGSA